MVYKHLVLYDYVTRQPINTNRVTLRTQTGTKVLPTKPQKEYVLHHAKYKATPLFL